jgi:hypothetical protein
MIIKAMRVAYPEVSLGADAINGSSCGPLAVDERDHAVDLAVDVIEVVVL